MPQPVHYSHAISFDFGPEAILDRPNLAAHVAAISARWNEIEARTAAFLAALLGGEAKTGISIFFAITNDGAKRAAIDSICALKLSKPQQDEFKKLLKTVGERYSERNRAIHGVWGTSPEYPNALLWSDIRETILLHIELMAIPGPENQAKRKDIGLKFQKNIMVWKEKDFEDAEKRIETAYNELYNFTLPFINAGLAPAGLKSGRREDQPLPYSRAHPDPNDPENGQ